MKLFIWKDTSTLAGSWWGGTLFAIADSPDQAREVIRASFKNDNSLGASEGSDSYRLPATPEELYRLEKDLSKEPLVALCGGASGGDY